MLPRRALAKVRTLVRLPNGLAIRAALLGNSRDKNNLADPSETVGIWVDPAALLGNSRGKNNRADPAETVGIWVDPGSFAMPISRADTQSYDTKPQTGRVSLARVNACLGGERSGPARSSCPVFIGGLPKAAIPLSAISGHSAVIGGTSVQGQQSPSNGLVVMSEVAPTPEVPIRP